MANSRTLESARLLVVSQERSALGLLWAIAEANGWELETASSGWEALERVQTGTKSGVVVLDFSPGNSDGMYTLRWLRRVNPELHVVVLSRSEDDEPRREALRLGASEYLVRPLDEQLLEAVIRRCFEECENSRAGQAGEGVDLLNNEELFVAVSPAMRKLRAQAELLAQVNAPLLIVGESGSGKESVARLIHKLSGRYGFRFSKVDCASYADDLSENELFGPARFEANINDHPSQFELCHKGTLLLDEITALPMSLQGRLLRILQEGHSVLRAEDGRDLDVRILASTKTNIEKAVGERKLREDLYYRLSAFTVHVPPLRQRKEEIPVFFSHLMKNFAKRLGLPVRPLSPALLSACQAYSWPGNLRELEEFVKQYLIASDDFAMPGTLAINQTIAAAENEPGPALPIENGRSASAEGDAAASGLKSLLQNVRGETERSAIANALEQTRWNRKAAAQLLKVSYRTLLYKIQQYHMKPPGAAYPYVTTTEAKAVEELRQEFGSRAIRENRS